MTTNTNNIRQVNNNQQVMQSNNMAQNAPMPPMTHNPGMNAPPQQPKSMYLLFIT
jgi:hypothetical protein